MITAYGVIVDYINNNEQFSRRDLTELGFSMVTLDTYRCKLRNCGFITTTRSGQYTRLKLIPANFNKRDMERESTRQLEIKRGGAKEFGLLVDVEPLDNIEVNNFETILADDITVDYNTHHDNIKNAFKIPAKQNWFQRLWSWITY